MPTVKGQKEYERFLKGGKLTYSRAILAMCYSCISASGRDCESKGCPLYSHMPYRTGRTKKPVNLTGEEKKAVAERLRRGKDARRRRRV